jgi:outer membrane murein-binding lipoprotein Lpp
MASSIDPQEFGRLQAKVDNLHDQNDRLEDRMNAMQQDIKELLAAMENARGSWRTLVLLGGAAATLGGLLVKFFPILGK